MATTRAELQASLQRKTDGKLTLAADQNIYLALAERQVVNMWYTIDPELFRLAQQTATTSASGILSVPATFMRLERLEDASKIKYDYIDNINERWTKTGYYTAGYDQVNKQRTFQVMKNGAVLVSTAMYWYDEELLLGLPVSGVAASDEPVLPESARDLIASRAAYLWAADQGPSFIPVKEGFFQNFTELWNNVKDVYSHVTTDPQYIESSDPDAGVGISPVHRVS